jgi:NhaP-type Na+/H+ or K+/H+ antiporter
MGDVAGILGVLTGLVSIIMSLGIAFWWIYWSYRKKQLQYEERRLMIERGLTPPAILPEEAKIRTPQEFLRRGLVLLFLGGGIGAGAVVAAATVEQELGGLLGIAAAIVAFIGLGNLVYYFIARRMAKNAGIAPLP